MTIDLRQLIDLNKSCVGNISIIQIYVCSVFYYTWIVEQVDNIFFEAAARMLMGSGKFLILN